MEYHLTVTAETDSGQAVDAVKLERATARIGTLGPRVTVSPSGLAVIIEASRDSDSMLEAIEDVLPTVYLAFGAVDEPVTFTKLQVEL